MFEKSREQGTPSPNNPASTEIPKNSRAILRFARGVIFLCLFAAIIAYALRDDAFKDSKLKELVTGFAEGIGREADRPPPPPPFSDTVATSFAEEAYIALMTIKHPTTLEQHMNKVRPYLTEDGYYSIKDAMSRGRIIDGGQDVSVTFTDRLKLHLQHGEYVRGTWRWTLQAPVNITYTTPQKSRVDAWDVRIVVQPKADGRPGIAQISAIPR